MPIAPCLLSLMMILPVSAAFAQKAARRAVFRGRFTANFMRSMTSQERTDRLDVSKGRIAVDGAKVRFDMESYGGKFSSAEVYDFDAGRSLYLDLAERTYTGAAITALMVDSLLNLAFPIGKFSLKKTPDDGPVLCAPDAHYTVLPVLPAKELEAWKKLKARMYVCLSPKGVPSLSAVTTVELDGRPWKNIVTFSGVKTRRAPAELFSPPADFRKAQ